jgi:hypothetical protein
LRWGGGLWRARLAGGEQHKAGRRQQRPIHSHPIHPAD